MLLDDLSYVFGLDLCVPDAFGIDENGWTDLTKIYRATIRQHHFATRIAAFRFFALTQTLNFKDTYEFGFDIGAAASRA